MATNREKQELSNLAHFGYQVLPELLKEWCGTEKLSGTFIGMIPGMRQTNENKSAGSVDLVKVVQVDTTQAVNQYSVPTPITSNM